MLNPKLGLCLSSKWGAGHTFPRSFGSRVHGLIVPIHGVRISVSVFGIFARKENTTP